MLYDRDYMRNRGGGIMWSASAIVMAAMVGVFMLQAIDDVYGRGFITSRLALSGEDLRRGHVWQLITFQFLHGGLMHLLFNLVGLWFVGRAVEQMLGPARFLWSYFVGGAAGGILQAVLSLAYPAYFGGSLVGASAGIFALLAIFCLLQPNSEVRLYFLIPIRAIWLLYGAGAISLFFTLVPARGGVSHAAHLGGILLGVLFVQRHWHQDFRPLPGSGLWNALRALFSRRGTFSVSGPPRQAGNGGSRPPRVTTVSPVERSPNAQSSREALTREVDAILEKIAAHGIHSLTDRERKVLEEARKKLAN